MQSTLIIPCAGYDACEEFRRPEYLLTAPNGELVVRLAAESVDLAAVSKIVVGVAEIHEQKFGAVEAVKRAFLSCNVPLEVVVISEKTTGPGDTVDFMISRAKIMGPILIKDGDSFFSAAICAEKSLVAVCDVRLEKEIAAIGEKSFCLLNEQGLVRNIVEKQVCSNLIAVGLYGFSDASIFLKCYRSIVSSVGMMGIFVSHVMSEAISLGEVVSPIQVSSYVDVSVKSSWHRFRQRQKTLVLDIDGVVFENHSKYFSPYWEQDDKPIEKNVERLLVLQKKGAQLIFMTARPEQYRKKTLDALAKLGLEVHALVTGCLHGQRYLINDFAPSNPYPTALAVNLERNSAALGTVFSNDF